jgi:hypothetical protein
VEQIELAVAQCVVNEAMRFLHSAGRHADEMKYRYVLGIRPPMPLIALSSPTA